MRTGRDLMRMWSNTTTRRGLPRRSAARSVDGERIEQHSLSARTGQFRTYYVFCCDEGDGSSGTALLKYVSPLPYVDS